MLQLQYHYKCKYGYNHLTTNPKISGKNKIKMYIKHDPNLISARGPVYFEFNLIFL